MTVARRLARKVRIHCPVTPQTLTRLCAGDHGALETDPTAAAMLAILRDAGPLGDFGLYTGVMEIGFGLESFVPAPGAAPTLGQAGVPSRSPTVVLTTYVAEGVAEAELDAVLARILDAHPWEIPVIEVSPDPAELVLRG